MRSYCGGPRHRALTMPVGGKAPAIPIDGVASIPSNVELLFAAVSTANPGG